MAMLPRLEAEEAMRSANVAALGAGTMQRDDAARMTARLERAAGGNGRAPRADPRALAIMGIAVEVVPPAAAKEG